MPVAATLCGVAFAGVLAGSGAPSARAEEVVDQSAASLGTGSTQIRACAPCGQGFVPGEALHVGVSVHLARLGAGLPDTEVRLRVRAGGIAGPVVAEAARVPLQSGAVAAWQDFFFDFPVELEPGASYTLELESEDPRAAWTWTLADVYPRGSSTVAGTPLADTDFWFETLVEDGVTDADRDGLPDATDPCPDTDDDGLDSDDNGTGDACECGDASGDGRVDSLDARLIQRCSVGVFECPELCDTSGDERCNSLDARLVQRAAVGQIAARALVCAQDPHRGAPDAVREVAARAEGGGVLVSWSAPPNPPAALRYDVHAAPTRRFEPTADTLVAQSDDATPTFVTGLEPDTLYHVVVVAFGDLERPSRAAVFAPVRTGPAAP